jgi:signal transduction histidine kinase
MAGRLENMVEEIRKNENNRRELIAGISHDLRTPLTAIKAYLEGIETGVANTQDKKNKYFQVIKTKTIDLEHIINQLFLFSRLDAGEFPLNMRILDIGQMLESFIDGIKRIVLNEKNTSSQSGFSSSFLSVVQVLSKESGV